jgi:dienelactone hydrolase
MNFKKYFLPLSVIVLLLSACGNASDKKETKVSVKEENVTYSADSVTMNGFVAYDASVKAKRPVVLIVHEWWGLNNYVRNRAKQLAAMGYLAFAVDMFGNGATAAYPGEAQNLAMPFYSNPEMAKAHFDAALRKIKSYEVADTTRVAAIGYCFGGGMLLNIARMGEDMKGIVSFHGSLNGVKPERDKVKADILVCHGDSDTFVSAEDVAQFKHEMDSAGINYTFKAYAGATHAFSNPDATENGKKFNLPIAYNAEADTASWNDMNAFFGKIFK